MGGFFGVASKQDCVFDLFFGIDYHSHLGTRRGGMAVYGKDGFNRAIHNIENAPFRTKFDKDVQEMSGHMGIGCISDYEPQPLIVRSHHGTYALTTVSKINNTGELTKMLFKNGHSHFLEMSGGDINATELIAALINQKENLIEGIQFALDSVEGSVSILLMNQAGIYAARDKYGRTPVVIGKKEDAYCITFENFAYKNLGYKDYKELGPGEIAVVTDKNCITLVNPNKEMKICTFLWVYYGYPSRADIQEIAGELGITVEKLKNVISSLHEFNPMMGHRGCRLAVSYPEIAEMQTTAVINAAIAVTKKGVYKISPNIMIPLVGEVKELKYVRDVVVATADKIIKASGIDMKYEVGTMIEIPRAALTADEIAKEVPAP